MWIALLSVNHGHILCDDKASVIKAPHGSHIKIYCEKHCERILVISTEKVKRVLIKEEHVMQSSLEN